MKYLIAIGLVALMLSSCAALDGYERRYSVGYEDREGNRTDVGVTLVPRAIVVRGTK